MSVIAVESLVLEIAERMSNPETVSTFMLDPANGNPNPTVPHPPSWGNLNFASGHPSLLLFYGTLHNQGLKDFSEVIHKYTLIIKDAIEKEGIHDLSFYSGLTGICFSLHQASDNGKKYGRMLNTLHQVLISRVQDFFIVRMQENIRSNTPSPSYFYDVISGITGIGRYALTHLAIPEFQKLAQDIASVLVEFIKPLSIQGYQVPGWYLPAEDRLNERTSAANPRGNFNLGLAHGVTGVLSYLAFASLSGIEVPGQKETIRLLSDWITSKSFKHQNSINWPYTISWDEEMESRPSLHKEHSRAAWCYGVPGVARTLYIAGKALKDENLKTFAATAFRGVFNSKPEAWNIPGPGLCHGIAGLLVITAEMAKEKGCEDLLVRAEELKQMLLSSYNPAAPFGFRDIEPCLGGGIAEVDKVGFLEGNVGALLTLSTLYDAKPQWHLPLMI